MSLVPEYSSNQLLSLSALSSCSFSSWLPVFLFLCNVVWYQLPKVSCSRWVWQLPFCCSLQFHAFCSGFSLLDFFCFLKLFQVLLFMSALQQSSARLLTWPLLWSLVLIVRLQHQGAWKSPCAKKKNHKSTLSGYLYVVWCLISSIYYETEFQTVFCVLPTNGKRRS